MCGGNARAREIRVIGRYDRSEKKVLENREQEIFLPVNSVRVVRTIYVQTLKESQTGVTAYKWYYFVFYIDIFVAQSITTLNFDTSRPEDWSGLNYYRNKTAVANFVRFYEKKSVNATDSLYYFGY